MYDDIEQAIDDCKNPNLPKDSDDLDKLYCESLKLGTRIYWYYKEDLEQFADEAPHIRDYHLYSGIVVPLPDVENRGELEYNECMVCIDQYPTEKEYPQFNWTALNRLLDDKDLVEIY